MPRKGRLFCLLRLELRGLVLEIAVFERLENLRPGGPKGASERYVRGCIILTTGRGLFFVGNFPLSGREMDLSYGKHRKSEPFGVKNSATLLRTFGSKKRDEKIRHACQTVSKKKSLQTRKTQVAYS